MNKRNALIVIGKAPLAGQVKTRLIPPLTPRGAAQLYKCFLLDTMLLADTVTDADVYLLYVRRPGAEKKLRQILPPQVRLLPQQGKGIGEGSAYGFRYLLGEGYANVVLIGSDNPTLPPAYLEYAYRELEQADLVLGPTEDGGYYLIGMSQPHLGVFEDIAWSTEQVASQVRERAAALNLSVRDVPRWYDVDSVSELKRLAWQVTSPDSMALHTRTMLWKGSKAYRMGFTSPFPQIPHLNFDKTSGPDAVTRTIFSERAPNAPPGPSYAPGSSEKTMPA